MGELGHAAVAEETSAPPDLDGMRRAITPQLHRHLRGAD